MSKLPAVLGGMAAITRERLKRVAHHRHLATLAASPSHDDVYVVSFPRSGATWMNFLMANVHIIMSGDKRRVTFFNLHHFVPDIHVSRHLRSVLPFPGFLTVKSHAPLNPYYRNVLYLVRDPRDVMVSYHQYLSALHVVSGDLGSFLRSDAYGVRAWCAHVKGWMEGTSEATRFTYFRYEDLKSAPLETLKRLYGLLGHDVPDEVLQAAIAASSLDAMRALEKDYGYGGRAVADRLEFVRQGAARGWQGELGGDDLAVVEETCAVWLDRFGYNKS